MLSGSPVYTPDQHIIIASQSDSVLILGKNLAEENRVASSNTCSTGLSSKYIMSMYARALNLKFSLPT